ncbi:MAG TPA: flagellar biosynthesis protein FlhF [Polyangia bacterium]|jgi:flagellar biosynthesis protein FlhF|nr:flagellar biosynthesis protein FlhF [Polyangia bacterium]
MNAHETVVRTFRAPDAMSALNAVKAAFGREAVILKTREIAGGLFGKPQVEVTAASSMAELSSKRTAAFERTPAQSGVIDRPARAAIRRYSEADMAGGGDRGAMPGHDIQDEVSALRRVVEEMRRRMETDQGAQSDARALFVGESMRVYRLLMQRGVEEHLARELCDEARKVGSGSEVEVCVKAELRKRLAPAPAPWLAEGRRTVALIGPTGVGKTTGIAKIAARAVLETKFKCALITVDTYRVGASDQLARYGKIMGLATHVARDQAGLAAAMDRSKDADLVLIDTAGRSSSESLAAQTALLRTVPNIQLHLVLSAATGGRELGAAVRRYQSSAPDRIIFSKLDEADGPGSVYSAVHALQRPVSCVTDGQRVPEDIHQVESTDLVKLVFGT